MSKRIGYVPQGGVCSRFIEVVLDDDNIVERVQFVGGCAGNTQGVAALATGRPAEEVVAILEGIDCRGKGTSCPDQLAHAIRRAIEAK